MSDSLQPHESQHARPPCPSPSSTPGLPVHHHLPEFTQTHVHRVSDAMQPSHPLLSPSPPAPQSLRASESIPMSQLFAWGGRSTGVSALVSFLQKNTQGWSPLEWTGWISLQSKRLSTPQFWCLLPTPQFKSINITKINIIYHDFDAGRDWGQEEKRTTEDEMAAWHHWLDGHESVWTLGIGDGHGGVSCCDSWGHKESDAAEQLNWTELKFLRRLLFWGCMLRFSISYHLL